MQENKISYYIYVESKTGFLLKIKKSNGLSFDFNIPGIRTYVIEGVVSPLPTLEDKMIYSPESGFKKAHAFGELKTFETIDLLKKKLDIMISLRTNVELSRKEIIKKFSDENLMANKKTSEEYFHRYYVFMKNEEKLLIGTINSVLSEYEIKISQMATVDELSSFYKHIVNNVNIGAYSFIKQQ